MISRLPRVAIVAAALAFGSGAAAAETRALVVGVSGYPALAKSLHLVGPKNDSREMANTLAALGVPKANITVLADGIEGLADGLSASGVGTKKAVLDGLDRLAAESRPGDLAVFYFSGHGSQQADADGDEQGGADEIFLPYDVGKWSGAGVENAIVDDELNARIAAILDKGVDFFGVIDACHSATGFRAVEGDDAVSRRVDPADLGVPGAQQGEVKRGLAKDGERKPGRGRAAFFYAAQESEEALEKAPKGAAPGESYGVFTYNMLARLNRTPNLTYRTLHQAVLADIKRNTLAPTQTPELEGDLLDEPVLRLSQAPERRQWPIFGGKLQAGQLAGIQAGSVVALYDDPAAPDEAALAQGVVTEAGATKSLVSPVAPGCAADAGVDCAAAPDEAAFKKGRFARLVETGIDLSVVLSEPLRVDSADGRDYSAAVAALKAAVAAPTLKARVSLQPTGYDVAVGLVDGTLAFAPAGGLIDQDGRGSSPRLTLPADTSAATAAVTGAIDRITRALALQRLGGSTDEDNALGLSATIRLAKAAPQAAEPGACDDDGALYEPAKPVSGDPAVGACDVVSVEMKNDGRKPLDVTVLLIGRDFSITTLWPLDGSSNRVDPSEAKTADLFQIVPDGEPASRQRLVFIAVPGVGKSHTVFDTLDQEGLRDVPGESAEASAARRLLAAGLTDFSRAAATTPAGIEEEMAIEIRPFSVGASGG